MWLCFPRSMSETPRVEISGDKAHEYRLIYGMVHERRSVDGFWVPSEIEYLGFAMDGKRFRLIAECWGGAITGRTGG